MMGGIMQVFISKDERQWGPYDAAQMGCLIERGSFSLQDWAWIEGNADWVPLHQILYTLSNEKKAESQKLHQKVEVAKDLWRSKMTQPTPAVFREERPRNARTTRQVAAAAAGGWAPCWSCDHALLFSRFLATACSVLGTTAWVPLAAGVHHGRTGLLG